MGCARMSLEYSICDSKMIAYCGERADIDTALCNADASMYADTMLYDAAMSADAGARGRIEAYKATKAILIPSFVCSIDLGKNTIIVLTANDGTPILTVDGEYLILKKRRR